MLATRNFGNSVWLAGPLLRAGFLLTDFLVQPAALVKVKRSVFLLQDQSDPKPVGVGVFFAPRLAVTADHNLLETTREGSKVTATFGCDSPRYRETLELVVVHRCSASDFALLQAIHEQPACLAPYTGLTEHLLARNVALCCYQLEIAPELEPTFGTEPSLGTMRGTVVKLSPHQNHLIVQSDSWPGDSGAAVIVSDGQLVGILTEGVNSLRDKIERLSTVEERLNEVELSVAQAARSVASGCIVLSHKVFVERAQQLGLLFAAQPGS